MARSDGGPILESVRALVVDDSEIFRKRFLELLAESQVEAREAGSAGDALRLLAADPVDVVVIDLRLGAESGLDLIGDVKAMNPVVVVMVLTSEVSDAHRRACLERGADFFFDKSQQFEQAAGVIAGCERAGATRRHDAPAAS
jgi:CheY-like chemotaxis protein